MPFKQVFMERIGLDFEDPRIKLYCTGLISALKEIREVKEVNLFNGSVDVVVESTLLIRNEALIALERKIEAVIEEYFAGEVKP